MANSSSVAGLCIAACVVLAFATASCGSDAITSGNNDPVPPTPRCAAGELAVVGILDGVQVSDRVTGYNFLFINKLGPGPGTIDADKDSFVLHIEWGVLLANGDSTKARGWARGSGFDVGNPANAAFSGTLSLDDDGEGGHFLLKELRHAPYESGAVIRGAVAGCFRS